MSPPSDVICRPPVPLLPMSSLLRHLWQDPLRGCRTRPWDGQIHARPCRIHASTTAAIAPSLFPPLSVTRRSWPPCRFPVIKPRPLHSPRGGLRDASWGDTADLGHLHPKRSGAPVAVLLKGRRSPIAAILVASWLSGGPLEQRTRQRREGGGGGGQRVGVARIAPEARGAQARGEA